LLIEPCVMNRKLMVSDVFSPKLLDGHPVTFERAEGLNNFVVRVNGDEERIISRDLWHSLMEQTPGANGAKKEGNT
jgi:hypothetical protein